MRKNRSIVTGIVAQLMARDPSHWGGGATTFEVNWRALQRTARETRMPVWKRRYIAKAQIASAVGRCHRQGVSLAPKQKHIKPVTRPTSGLALELAQMEG